MGLLSPTLSIRHCAGFCHHLAWSLQSGIPLLRTLELQAQEGEVWVLRRLTARLQHNIEKGATFAHAMHWEGRRLPELITAMAMVGERTGRLSEVFSGLSQYYDELLRFRQKLVLQIVYPLAVVAVAVVWLPIFRALFIYAGDNRLPWIAAGILWRTLTPLVIWCGVYGLINHLLPLRRIALNVLSYIWPISTIIRGLALSRFAWAMHLILKDGVLPQRALKFAAPITGLRGMSRNLSKAAPLLKEGATCLEAFSSCRVFTPIHRTYLETGEQTGHLAEAFSYIAKDELEKAYHRIRISIILIGPALIILCGFLAFL